MSANDRQVGGDHYHQVKIQHWDWAVSEGLDYFQGCITKYVARWRKKGGIEDLKKAAHYLEKYIEVEEAKIDPMFRRGEAVDISPIVPPEKLSEALEQAVRRRAPTLEKVLLSNQTHDPDDPDFKEDGDEWRR